MSKFVSPEDRMCRPIYEKYYYHIKGVYFKVNREYGKFSTNLPRGFDPNMITETNSNTAIIATWDVAYDLV